MRAKSSPGGLDCSAHGPPPRSSFRTARRIGGHSATSSKVRPARVLPAMLPALPCAFLSKAHSCADCDPYSFDATRSTEITPLLSWLAGSSSRSLDGAPVPPRQAQEVSSVVADQENQEKKSHLFLRAPAGAQTLTHPSTPTGRSLPTPQRPPNSPYSAPAPPPSTLTGFQRHASMRPIPTCAAPCAPPSRGRGRGSSP